MLIGYCRVSTNSQHLRMQEDALKKIGCDEIYTDIASGVKAKRPGLEKALDKVRQDDTLVVWKLDRLGRSIQHLIETVKSLSDNKVGFKSIEENIDTTSSGGKLIFHIFSALAEFERDLIKERTQAGLKAARARGRLGGRPPALSPSEIKKLKKHHKKGELSIKEMCKMFGISKPTLYSYVNGAA